MIVRKLRLNRGWSQDQLSQLSGLSIRTIQRIEGGQNAGLESLKSLAAVFEIQIMDLKPETVMVKEQSKGREIRYTRSLKGFYWHLSAYALVVSGLLIINFVVSPQYIWAKWPALGWGIGIAFHGLRVFKVFRFWAKNWNNNSVEKDSLRGCE